MRQESFVARVIRGAGILSIAFLIAAIGSRPAAALPSFARQTGQPCSSCHLGFPELTPAGRAFKLNGYVWGGGTSHLPPLSIMLQPAFTATAKGQPGGAAPDYGPNDNLALQQGGLFYGGAIDPAIGLGAFAQATYDSASGRIGWDNTDIRLAGNGKSKGQTLVYGLTLNNNPSVEDVWNTTPAWRFPYISSNLAPKPAAGTLIEGAQAQQVLGAGGYLWWNDLVYVELSGYRSLSKNTLMALGTDSTGTSSIAGVEPYWRVAVEPKWGSNSWEFGSFGLAGSLYPQRMSGFGTDSYLNYGFDTQYQFIGPHNAVSLEASWVRQNADWNASLASGLVANPSDTLGSVNAKASYLYNQKIGASIGWFDLYGTSDPGLYAPAPISGSANGSPNSNGLTFELDYYPFNNGGPSIWPWLNAKIGLQYVMYNKFNGGTHNYDGFGRSAGDNNTILAFAWVAF